MIGYPGNDQVVVGARGFYRTTITLHGHGGHSGSTHPKRFQRRREGRQLVVAIASAALPNGVMSSFPIGPSLTVTGIRGGNSFSTIPDICEVMIDARLTPAFTADDARELLASESPRSTAATPAPTPARVDELEAGRHTGSRTTHP